MAGARDAVRVLLVPVAGGLADGEANEGRDGDARGERADGAGDGHGLFREVVHGGHGGGGEGRERVGEAVELAVGRDELKRGAGGVLKQAPADPVPFFPAGAYTQRPSSDWPEPARRGLGASVSAPTHSVPTKAGVQVGTRA